MIDHPDGWSEDGEPRDRRLSESTTGGVSDVNMDHQRYPPVAPSNVYSPGPLRSNNPLSNNYGSVNAPNEPVHSYGNRPEDASPTSHLESWLSSQLESPSRLDTTSRRTFKGVLGQLNSS